MASYKKAKKALEETQKKMRASQKKHAKPAKSGGNYLQKQAERRKKKKVTETGPISRLQARINALKDKEKNRDKETAAGLLVRYARGRGTK